MISKAKSKVLLAASLLVLAVNGFGQKKPEKPKVHADFYYGTYPVLRDGASLLQKDNAKLLVVGFHQGWSLEKIAKEAKVAEEDLDKLYADMEEARLVTETDDGEKRPMLPVIRDKDIEKIQKELKKDTEDFAKMLQAYWGDVETTAASFAGAKGVPKQQLLYQIVAGAVLFGGMHDSFLEDQTLMVNPPRRAGNQRFYAWLVESDPVLAGVLKREQWESGGYTMVSIGPGLAKERMTLEQLRAAKGMMLEEDEARKFRSFVAIFTREKLLPFFKRNRSDFLRTLNLIDAGKYTSVSSAFAWYYDQVANGAVEQLVRAKLIQPSSGQYVFALKAPSR